MNLNKELDFIQRQLEEKARPEYTAQMEHFAIDSSQALGIKTPVLKSIAKPYRKNQPIAEALFKKPWHECKLLCAFTANPAKVDLPLADSCVMQLYSWDLVDQFCSCVFAKTEFAWELPQRWAALEGEFQRRAGIVMIAMLSMQFKKTSDQEFLQFLPLMQKHAIDERNFVKKAVSWSLRTLGKRSLFLHEHVLAFAEQLLSVNSKAAQWTARDVVRELNSDNVKARLNKQELRKKNRK